MELILLSAAVWITYLYTLKCGFVIDDVESYSDYSGKLQRIAYGDIAKWVRYHIVGGNTPSKQKYSDGKFIPMGRIPRNHHLLSIFVFTLAILASYPPLAVILGAKVALLSLLLFIVHPVVTQGVAWISGIGYPLSLLWMGVGLNVIQCIKPDSFEKSIGIFILFAITQYLMIHALVVTAIFCVILWFLGYHTYAVISLLCGLILCAQTILATHKERSTTFKAQNMGQSASINPKKIITVFQTLYYYVALILFPIKIGLYHKWGYHHNKTLEQFNWRFWAGVAILGVLIYGFLVGGLIVKFGILFFLCMIVGFLNWVTVQQFVTERYVFLPTLGICILITQFTQNTPIYYLILGLYLMRTWMHLPTYDNELKFYQSNIWNFPNSEVAYGNMGCTYLRMNKIGSAMDSWQFSREINPDYDVPNYNMFSNYKANAMLRLSMGDLQGAIELIKVGEPFLKNCVESKMCHFKEGWLKEYEEIKGWLADPYSLLKLERRRLNELQTNLSKELPTITDKDRIDSITKSLLDINVRLQQIDKIEEDQKCQKSAHLLPEAQASSAPTLEPSTQKPTA